MATRLISRVRALLGSVLSVRSLFDNPSVAQLATHLQLAPVKESAFQKLLPLRARGTRPPVFCFPPAGGLGWTYAGLLSQLGPDRPLYALQISSLYLENRLPASFSELVEDFAQTIKEQQPSGPYYLLGWSFGGHIAYAVASLLEQKGEHVALLALLDSYPPVVGKETALMSVNDLIKEYVAANEMDIGGVPATEENYDIVFETAQRTQLIPAGMDREANLRMFRMASRCSYIAREFRPAPIHGPMLFFKATEEQTFGDPSKRTGETAPESWAPYVQEPLEITKIRCRHFEMMTEPQIVREISQKLEEYLSKRNL